MRPAVSVLKLYEWMRQSRPSSIYDDAADALSLIHQVKCLVDLRKGHGVRDHGVDLDLPLHVPIDDFRHISASACPAKGGAFPDASGHQLEWACRYFSTGRGDANNDGLPPAAMAGL